MEPSSIPNTDKSRPNLWLAALPIVLVVLLYARTYSFDFVNFDDNDYVYADSHIKQGLTLANVVWAFTEYHGGHWHPLTTLSHALDVSLFGLWAGGHHLTSVALHALNALLLFIVLARMTRRPYLATIAAAIFAVHPLNVEPVVWISSRKDVLSTAFLFLTILAYERYARKPGIVSYAQVFACLSLGLLAKPNLVALPMALLALDYWPLGRIPLDAGPAKAMRALPWLIAEKLPLFLPALFPAWMTYQSAVAYSMAGGNTGLTLPYRLANAVRAAGMYPLQMIWPRGLAAFYPSPLSDVSMLAVAASALFIATATALALWRYKRSPYLLAGWYWYGATIAPVSGLVQAIAHATADRYVYVPMIGLLIAAIWGIAEATANRSPAGGRRWAFIAIPIVAALFGCAWVQSGYWRDSEAMCRRALAVTTNNATMRNNLGLVLVQRGELEAAKAEFVAAIQARPGDPRACYNLGVVLARQDHVAAAAEAYEQVLRLDPKCPDAHYNLVDVYERLGQADRALLHAREAARLDKTNVRAYYNLGNVLSAKGAWEEAVQAYREAIRMNPGYSEAHNNMGIALVGLNRHEEAAREFAEAIRTNPRNAEAHASYGALLVRQERTQEAIESFKRALDIDPDNAVAKRHLERLGQ